jgi:hypothetical protein
MYPKGGRSSGGGEVVPSVHATDLERGVEMLGARAGIVNTTAEDVRRSFQAHSGGAPSSSTHGHTSGAGEPHWGTLNLKSNPLNPKMILNLNCTSGLNPKP